MAIDREKLARAIKDLEASRRYLQTNLDEVLGGSDEELKVFVRMTEPAVRREIESVSRTIELLRQVEMGKFSIEADPAEEARVESLKMEIDALAAKREKLVARIGLKRRLRALIG